MQFTNLTFILVFLPITLIVYYFVKLEHRPIVAIAFSILFYSWGTPEYIGLLFVSVSINIIVSAILTSLNKKKNISKICSYIRNIIMVVIILLNLAVLSVFKYGKDLILPLGVSFYTFKVISYLADCYSGEIDKIDVIKAAEYLVFFPQISSGPISRYGIFSSNNQIDSQIFYRGTVRFMMGVSKKILLADVLYKITSEVFSADVLSTSLCWLGAICFSLQLYYDFSGYSDMAIGLSNMLGIKCEENFDHPYISKSISEFWRRWHITLGSFFRDYVYIPLGGSRKGIVRTIINLFIVWILTGIWHGNGMTFVIWGVSYFVLIAFEKISGFPNKINSKLIKGVYQIIVLLLVNFLWVIFNSNSIGEALIFLKSMIIYSPEYYSDLRAAFLLKDYIIVILLAVVFSIPISNMIKNKFNDNKLICTLYSVLEGTAIIGSFVLSLAFIVNGFNNPFLYSIF